MLFAVFVIIHEAAVGEDLALRGGQVLEIQVDRVDTVLGDHAGIDFFGAAQDGPADARDEHEVAGLVVEGRFGSDRKGHDTPVDTVAAIALGRILVADVGVAAEHLLAGSGLLAGGTVTRLVREDAGAEGSLLGIGIDLGEGFGHMAENIPASRNIAETALLISAFMR